MKNMQVVAVGTLLLLMLACSSTPPKPASETPAQPAKPAFQPTYDTGRVALQRMYVAARTWSADAKPYSLQSLATKDANGQDGKAGIWTAGFASPARRAVKVFTWSGIEADGAPEPGISSRPEDTYNPANTNTQIFEMAFLKIDSDEAGKAAEKHGGDKVIKQEKNTNVYYNLGWHARESKLVWRVAFGPEQNNPKITIDVDATSGEFMRVEK
jgi:hypothetical protein